MVFTLTPLLPGVPHLMVVTREEPPYVMIKCGNCSGNDRYEGFAIDLLAAISQVSLIILSASGSR